MKILLKSLDTASGELSSCKGCLSIRTMFIDEFAEMGYSAGDKDSMDFHEDVFPGDGDGGLHVPYVDEVEGVV